MKQDNKRRILFRYGIIIGLTLLFTVFIVYKMARTTVVDAHKWNEKANAVLATEIVVQPERGNIYADNGTLLAANLHYYTARLDFGSDKFRPDSLRLFLPQISDSLAKILPGKSSKDWTDLIEKELERPRRKRSIRIASNLTYSDYRRLKALPFFSKYKNRNIMYSEIDTKRMKPYGSMAARSIGGVGDVNGEIHGISGLEMALDSLLYGSPGLAHKIQVTNNLVNWETVPAQRGFDIKTTIDVEIQDMVEEELYNMCAETNALWATAVIMEVSTGEIKAISNLEWNDRAQRFVEGTNHAVLGYEPGSVVKTLSMLVALEDGLVSNIDQVITTGSSYTYASSRISDGNHGRASMPIRGIIESSSNVGITKILLPKYGDKPGQYYHRLKQLGVLEPLRTGIGGEQSFHIDSLGNRNWDRIALSRMLYGYATKIPPMNTLAIYNAIANDGKFVRPRLVKELMRNGVTDSVIPVSYIREQICSPKNAAKLRAMLHDVVWGERGTAKVLRNDKVEIAGKTGTCFANDKGQYNSSIKRLAFCGFFPYEKPKYSCIVLMYRSNLGAARCSGTVLKNVALKMYARGMLDNSSNYKESEVIAENKRAGVMFAGNSRKVEQQKKDMNLTNVHRYKSPKVYPKGEVPSVIGLGLKDAIAVLEKAGLNVRFNGLGYVANQSIEPGTKIKAGDVVTLGLKN